MDKRKFEKCIILYNPISTGFKENNLNLITNTLKYHGYKPESFKSTYQGQIIDLIKEVDDENILILTLGGDGTVKEAFEAYNQIKQKGLYSHIPTGTTNDMAKNFDVKEKLPNKIIEDIIFGEITTHDSFYVNNDIASYVSIFGYLGHIPYTTNPKLKKYLGHAGYVIAALPELIKKTTTYDISCEVDGKKLNLKCILGAVSNSKGFAGIDLFNNIKLNDSKLEYIFVKEVKPITIAKLFKEYLKNEIDLSKHEDILCTGSAKEIKVKFKDECPKHFIDIDGEKSNVLPLKNQEIIFKPAKQIKILKTKNTKK